MNQFKAKVRSELQPKPPKQLFGGVLAMVIIAALTYVLVEFGAVAAISLFAVAFLGSLHLNRKYGI